MLRVNAKLVAALAANGWQFISGSTGRRMVCDRGMTLLSRLVFSRQLLRVSAILVIIMGLMMAKRGLKITQSGFDFGSLLSNLCGGFSCPR